MPNCDGVEATRQIADRQPGVRVVVLTAFADDESVFAALRAGARGYLTKDAGAGEILQALSAVCAGEAQLDPSVQRRLVEAVVSGEAPGGPGTGPAPPSPPDGLTERELEVLTEIGAGLSNAEIAGKLRISGATVKSHINHLLDALGAGPVAAAPAPAPAGLTPRELDVLALIADGLSNAEIAARLVVAEATVKTHVNHILAKTGARDRAQVVAFAFRAGIAPA